MFIKNYIKLSILFLLNANMKNISSKDINKYDSIKKNSHIESDFKTSKQILADDIFNQINEIDKILENIAQAINNKTLKLKNSSDVKKFIKTLRNHILKIKEEFIKDNSFQYLNNIVEFNKSIIADIYRAFNNDLLILKKSYKNFTSKKSKHLHNLGFLEVKYNFNQNILKNLKNIKFDKVVQHNNRLDNILNKSDKFMKDWKLKKLLSRSWPYAILIGYIIVNQDDSKLASPLLKVKRIILSPFYRFSNTSTKENDKIENIIQMPEAKAVKEYKSTKFGDSINNIKKMKFIGIDTKPYISISPTVLFMKYIAEDLNSLRKESYNQFNKLINKLRNKHKDDNITFDKIVGFDAAKQELKDIIYYFKNIDYINNIGILSNVNNNYIITGDLDLSEKLIKATVGEINKNIDSVKKLKKCELLEIHSSELISKNLKNIITSKQNSSSNPLIILIKELELIDNMIDRKILIGIIKDIDQLNKNNKISIIATTNNKSQIAKALLQPNRLSNIIDLQAPNDQERSKFITQELSNYCINTNNFDILKLADKTDGYSYDQIRQWIKKAQFKAHQDDSILTQHYL